MNSNTILLEENVPHNNDPEPLHYQYTDVGLIEKTTQPQKKTLYYHKSENIGFIDGIPASFLVLT